MTHNNDDPAPVDACEHVWNISSTSPDAVWFCCKCGIKLPFAQLIAAQAEIERFKHQAEYWRDSLRVRSRENAELRATIAQLTAALEAQEHWHERQHKALSKSGRKDADALWQSGQHYEQLSEIRAALAAVRDAKGENNG